VLQRDAVFLYTDQQRPRNTSPNAGEGGVAGSQPMTTAVHITWHGARINFGDLMYLHI
jgi:hypothetical protein